MGLYHSLEYHVNIPGDVERQEDLEKCNDRGTDAGKVKVRFVANSG